MSTVTPLFRPEACQAQQPRAHGTVLLVGNRARRRLCLLFAAMAVALMLFLALASHARSATLSGIVTPADGIKRVTATAPGRIAAVQVSEGQMVTAGQSLLTLAGLRTDASGSNADLLQRELLDTRRASLQGELQRQEQQYRGRVVAAARAVDDLRQLLAQLTASLQLQHRRVQLADDGLRRLRQLAAGGHVAAMAVQDRESELLDQQQRLVELQRNVVESRHQLHAAQAARDELRLQAERDRAAAERSVAALEQELAEVAAHAEWAVTAPADGRIGAVRVQRGDEVAGGQLLFTLFNAAAPLVVELYAPSRAAGQLLPGQPVTLRYQAFPYQQFGQYRGTIRQISGNALQAGELAPEIAAAAARTGEALYRVRVHLEGETVRSGARHWRVQPGMLVDASVRLESRRLYQWLLAPLASVTGP